MNIIKLHPLKLVLLTIACILCFLPLTCFASAGDSAGGGTGQNSDIPLVMDYCSITNNEQNISCTPVIQMNFNKNVCDITVLSNNKLCFCILNEDNDYVPANLIFPDTQVQQNYKHEVFIKPIDPLESNTTYSVAISDSLMAKNGTSIKQPYVLKFTTGNSSKANSNETLSELDENVITYNVTKANNVIRDGLTENSDNVSTTITDTNSIAKSVDLRKVSIIALAIIAAIIVILAIVITKKQRKQ